jgi:hypothetical protein
VTVAEQIADFTIQMESNESPPSYERAYQMLLLAMLEIRQLQYRVNVLTDLNKESVK